MGDGSLVKVNPQRRQNSNCQLLFSLMVHPLAVAFTVSCTQCAEIVILVNFTHQFL